MAIISGNLSNDARLIIVNESDWTVESNTEESSGAFEIGSLADGKKTILSRNNSGECVGYGDVTSIEEAASNPWWSNYSSGNFRQCPGGDWVWE
jgi:hypothetical protein